MNFWAIIGLKENIFNFQVKKSQSEQLFLYQKKKRLEERLENQKARVCNQKLQYKKLATTSKESSVYMK